MPLVSSVVWGYDDICLGKYSSFRTMHSVYIINIHESSSVQVCSFFYLGELLVILQDPAKISPPPGSFPVSSPRQSLGPLLCLPSSPLLLPKFCLALPRGALPCSVSPDGWFFFLLIQVHDLSFDCQVICLNSLKSITNKHIESRTTR